MERPATNILDLPDDMLVEILCWGVEDERKKTDLQFYTRLFQVCKRFEWVAHHKHLCRVVFSPLGIALKEDINLEKYKAIVDKVKDALQNEKPLPALKDTGLDPSFLSSIVYNHGLYKNSHVAFRLLKHEFRTRAEFEGDFLKSLLSHFEFHNMDLDIALRLLLYHFKLPFTSQSVSVVLEIFGQEYYNQNSNSEMFPQADSVYVMVHCLLLLNVDLWNANVKVKMTCDEFIRDVRGLGPNRGDYPREYITQLYSKSQQFQFEAYEESRSTIFENKKEILAQGYCEVISGLVRTVTDQVYCVVYGNHFYYFESFWKQDPIGKIELHKLKVASIESPFPGYCKFTLTTSPKLWEKIEFTFRIATNYQWKRWEKVLSLL
eukprot:TRINITY_DN3241_c0_g1_i5.p1 TRINITY_DN3241_c0_g1~~TRINITY_DN3241_c0_g1_i5.p1  ORF type:complete len:377 (-),score=57.71 TRINITY_DN3241_c0_g1_i5:97-1227(-)